MNGELKIGQAIACAFKEGNQSEQAKARLRLLLACEDTEETCRILRPLLSLIQSRVKQSLDYAALLEDLFWFHENASSKKARWVQQFYHNPDEKNQGEA
uniref:CRISPR-associated protein Cse2 n=1 Tax=Arsenophonus endosymbiont of Trialeurodes vaporariorum TaxID=235567 RepID=A0A3B0LU27_9GAMM